MSLPRKLGCAIRLLHSQFTRNSAILLYHRVAEDSFDPFGLCVSPERFEQHLAAVSRVGNPVSLSDLLRGLGNGNPRRRSICLTFDDGFHDFLVNALPLLEKYEMPATIYVVTGNPGKPFWWDRLASIIYRPETLPTRIQMDSAGSALSLEPGGRLRESVFNALYGFLRDLAPEDRDRQIAVLAAEIGDAANGKLPRAMTRDELRRLALHPLITIGAHTVSHSCLASLGPSQQAREIVGSLDELSAILDRPVTTFSYPFGLHSRDFTATTMQLVREAGLDHAMAADLGVVTKRSNPYRLPRIWVHDRSGNALARKLNLWL